jgi:hypothetical protein
LALYSASLLLKFLITIFTQEIPHINFAMGMETIEWVQCAISHKNIDLNKEEMYNEIFSRMHNVCSSI